MDEGQPGPSVCNPMASVVVPVYQGMSTLPACLDALEQQSCAAYEVIVVDNGDNPGIERLCDGYRRVRLIRCTRPGSYASRNAGVAAAVGEVLAFTDADCVPDRDWLRAGVEGLGQNRCRMAGGRIEPSFRHAEAPTAIELCDAILHTMNQEQTLRECTSIACANMFVARSLFESVGLFNADLYSAGDCELTYRVRRQGETIACLPDAVVRHRARRTLAELAQRYRRFAGAEFVAKAGRDVRGPIQALQSLSFRYRVGLCVDNIVEGVRRYRDKRNPLLLLSILVAVEGYITAQKTIEYVRLGLGKPMQR